MILSNKLPIRTSQHGFTLVELVMVIVLIGVLSVGAQSLFSSKDAYVDYVAKERLNSMGLLAQQMALGVSADPLSGAAPTSDPSSIIISHSGGGDISFTLRKFGQTVQSYTLDQPVPAIRVNGVTLGAGSSSTLAWNQQANMKNGLNSVIEIVGAQTFSVCLSSSGYVYEC